MVKGMDRRGALSLLALTGTSASGLVGCGEEPSTAEESLGEASQELCAGNSLAAVPLSPLSLPGTYAYAQKTIRAGETIQFRISSDTNYRLSIVRLGWDTTGPSRDQVVSTFPQRSAQVQPIRKGSYAHVSQALPATAVSVMSLECWVRVSQAKWQGIISQYQYPNACGVGLFIDASGRPAMYWGDGLAFNSAWLKSSTGPSIVGTGWRHLVTTFNGGTAKLFVDGSLVASFTRAATTNPGGAVLRLGAYGQNSVTSYTLDGDIAMPAIYSKALSEGVGGEVATRATTLPPVPPSTAGLLGCWPLTEERGASLQDISNCVRSAVIFNRGTWMIGGPGFSPTAVSRASTVVGSGTYNPLTDASRGHGLRFSSEDLYDCGWSVSEAYTLPPDLLPGIYVGRVEYGSSLGFRYDTTFVVRAAATKPKARVLVLCNTNTWLAYTVPFPNFPWAIDGWGTGGPSISAENAPAFNMYSRHRHREGSTVVGNDNPTFQVGVQMPWGAFPYAAYIGTSYGHLVRAERPLHVWLEQMGYDYDVAGDLDLEADTSLVNGYKMVVITGHSEYWSSRGYGALESYLGGGGKLIVLSGNTMFWRVSFDAQRQIMECRKCPGFVGGQTDGFGEIYHSQDFARGGLMREAGYPAWKLTGLESVGYDAPAGTYNVQAPSHSFFQSPEPIAVTANAAFATGSVQHEYDVRLATIPGTGKPAPLAGAAPTPLLSSSATAGTYFDYAAQPASLGAGAVVSEVIDWHRGPGGRVFAAGAIAIGTKLGTDAPLAALLRNVMHQFGVAHRIDFFVRTADGKVRNKRWNGTAWLPLADGTGWDDLGGTLVVSPTVAQVSPNLFALMGINSSGALQYRYWDGAQWQAWSNFGGSLQGKVAALLWARDRLNIFGRGLDNKIYCRVWDGSSWFSWQDMSGTMSGPPAAGLFNGNPVVCAVGTNGHLMYRYSDGTSWFPTSSWEDLGGTNLTGTPVVTNWGGNRLSIFVTDTSGNLFTKEWDGTSWLPSQTGWTSLGSGVQGTPSVAVRSGDKLSLFVIGTNGHVLSKYREGTSAAWGPTPTTFTDLGGDFTGSPTAVSWRGDHVSVLATTTTSRFSYRLWNGTSWGAWLDLSGTIGGSVHPNPQAVAWIGTV